MAGEQVSEQDDQSTVFRDERWAVVERAANSQYLGKSTRLRQFLFYVCERALTGRRDEIHEVQIGLSVYHKPPDYNASEDNVVRVDARRLRKALESYFAAEGKREPFTISIPKGAYVPVFEPRAPSQSDASSLPPSTAESAQVLRERTRPFFGRPWLIAAILLLTNVLAGAALLWQWRQARTSRGVMAREGRATAGPSGILLAVLDEGHRTNVVVSDAGFPLIQRHVGVRYALADYLNRSYEKSVTDRVWRSLARQDLTDFNSVQILADLMHIAAGDPTRVQVRFPRQMELSDLKAGHTILIGSRSATPFCEVFADKRNFLYQYDEKALRSYYRNRNPLPGEDSTYYGSGKDGSTTEQYGVVCLLPNLGNTGNVLIIEGTTPAGTQAAWEFIRDPAQSAKFLRTVGVGKHEEPSQYFDVLVRTLAVAGKSRQPAYVAHRILSP